MSTSKLVKIVNQHKKECQNLSLNSLKSTSVSKSHTSDQNSFPKKSLIKNEKSINQKKSLKEKNSRTIETEIPMVIIKKIQEKSFSSTNFQLENGFENICIKNFFKRIKQSKAKGDHKMIDKNSPRSCRNGVVFNYGRISSEFDIPIRMNSPFLPQNYSENSKKKEENCKKKEENVIKIYSNFEHNNLVIGSESDSESSSQVSGPSLIEAVGINDEIEPKKIFLGEKLKCGDNDQKTEKKGPPTCKSIHEALEARKLGKKPSFEDYFNYRVDQKNRGNERNLMA